MGVEFSISVAHFVMARATFGPPEFAFVAFEPSDRVAAPVPGEPAPNRYRVKAQTMARRLDLLGVSLAMARRAFDRGVAGLTEDERAARPSRLLDASAFEEWSTAMRAALDASRVGTYLTAAETDDDRLRFMLDFSDESLGFPSWSFETLFRAVLAAAAPDDDVELDFDELVEAGYLADKPELWTVEGQKPLIVVTEGTFDSSVLRDALGVLYPSLARFFSFIDFETANAQGGAPELVRFVRMFIGCGIRNRIVALFDNDTQGHESLMFLQRKPIPSNVFAMTLPPIEAAKSYPTILADGSSSLTDINGTACSLELYLGNDLLRDEHGSPLPVRWKGFNALMKRHQGQIDGKPGIQKRFQNKLRAAIQDQAPIPQLDFSGLILIFESIFLAVANR